MIAAAQLRAAWAFIGIDQRPLAERLRLSLPTLPCIEANRRVIRGNVGSLTKCVAALDTVGVEPIADRDHNAGGGRGVRLKGPAP